MRSQHSRPRALALGVAGLVVLGTLLPSAAQAASSPDQDRAEVRRERARTASQLDALRAEQGEITAALGALDDNLTAQRALAEQAAAEQAVAAQEAVDARRAEEAKQSEIAELELQARNLALGLYMGRSSAGVASLVPGEDAAIAIYRGAMSEMVLGGAESSVDALDSARQDLAAVRERSERARDEAAQRQQQAEAEGRQLAEAMDLAERKQDELDARVDQNLAEAAALAQLDSRLSKQIADREQAIAAELRKSQARLAATPTSPGSSGGGRRASGGGGRPAILPAAGNLVVVGGIKVDASIADSLARMMAAASAAGFQLGGGGYRSADAQIAVRRNNCGPTEYDIWQKPASQCRPPAARPGTSMHEQGLAIDFTCNGALISSYGSSCYAWLKAHAPSFGFRNRPGEAWHWSPNGN